MRLGLMASAFDPIHPGYPWAWRQAIDAGACDAVVVAIHRDPSIEKSEKRRPALTLDERAAILREFRAVNNVLTYDTEQDLVKLIYRLKPACLIVGEDHKADRVTGADLATVFWAKRKPEWSGTAFATRIARSLHGWNPDIPVVPFGTKHAGLSLYRYHGNAGDGTVARLGLSPRYILFPDGDPPTESIKIHNDWRDFCHENPLAGHCVFPHEGKGPCEFCTNESLGCFAIEGAPVSLPLCRDHLGARWNHATRTIVFPGVTHDPNPDRPV